MDISFGVDRHYAPHAAAVIASVVRLAPREAFRFLILHSEIDLATQAEIEAIAPDAAFVWIEISDEDFPELPIFAGRGYLNRSTLFRLGLERLAPPDCHKVLYLDVDICLLKDVGPLWRGDLGGQPIGAVIDAYMDPAAFAERFGLPRPGAYFNAGVLLIDLDRIRAEGLFSRAIAFFAENQADLEYHDQDALNYVFWGRWQALEVAWNAQRYMLMSEGAAEPLPLDRRLAGQQPAIIHFTGPEKPWLSGVWHPWAWVYWDALARTPYTRLIARRHGVSFIERQRLRLRWLRRCVLPSAVGRSGAPATNGGASEARPVQ